MLFLSVMVLQLGVQSFKETSVYSLLPESLYKFVAFPVPVAVALQCVTHLAEKKKIVAGFLITALYTAVFIINYAPYGNYGALVILGLLTTGCIGIDYRNVLKAWVWRTGYVIAITALAASTGVVENIVTGDSSIRNHLSIRGALGFLNSNSTSMYILFFLAVLWVVYENISDTAMAILCVTALAFITLYSNSFTSMACLALLLFFCCYNLLEQNYRKKSGKEFPVKRLVEAVTMFAVPFFTLGALFMAFLY